MKKILPTVSDLFSPVQEWEEHLREISKGSQANFLLTNEQEKKEVTNVLGEIFFTKIETIILTDCFFKFSGVFRVNDHGKPKKYQKMIFLLHCEENIFFTVKKIFSSQ